MVQVLQARNITLRDLIEQFSLERVQDPAFFTEWREHLPQLSEQEKQVLDTVKAGFLNLLDYPPLLEKTVQLAVLSPLFVLAGFFLPPFHIQAEKSTELVTEDEGVTVRGQLDLLVLKGKLWVLVIESKEVSYSLQAGLAQLLTYMLTSPDAERPCFGMLTNGASSAFVKVQKGSPSRYALSNQFDLQNEGNELYPVLQIMKRLSQV